MPTLSTDLLPFAILKLVDVDAVNAPVSLRIVRGGEGAGTRIDGVEQRVDRQRR